MTKSETLTQAEMLESLLALTGVLIKRLGGRTVITQAELDEVNGRELDVEMAADESTVTVSLL